MGWCNTSDPSRKDPRCRITGTLIDTSTESIHPHVRRRSDPRWKLFPDELVKKRHCGSEGGRRGVRDSFPYYYPVTAAAAEKERKKGGW